MEEEKPESMAMSKAESKVRVNDQGMKEGRSACKEGYTSVPEHKSEVSRNVNECLFT